MITPQKPNFYFIDLPTVGNIRIKVEFTKNTNYINSVLQPKKDKEILESRHRHINHKLQQSSQQNTAENNTISETEIIEADHILISNDKENSYDYRLIFTFAEDIDYADITYMSFLTISSILCDKGVAYFETHANESLAADLMYYVTNRICEFVKKVK